METELVGLGGVAGAGVVLAVVALIRQMITIPDRYTSGLAVLVGIGLNVALRFTDAADVSGDWMATILTGFLAGLAASGLWSAGKSIRNKPVPPSPVPPPA
jgi:hypothetical protein